MNMHLFAALRADAVRILYVQSSLITVGSTAGPGSLNRRSGVVEAGHGRRNHEETSGKSRKRQLPVCVSPSTIHAEDLPSVWVVTSCQDATRIVQEDPFYAITL